MMLQNVNIALSVVLCGCLLSGCNNSTTSASSSVSSPSTSDYESSSAATSNLDSYEDEEPNFSVRIFVYFLCLFVFAMWCDKIICGFTNLLGTLNSRKPIIYRKSPANRYVAGVAGEFAKSAIFKQEVFISPSEFSVTSVFPDLREDALDEPPQREIKILKNDIFLLTYQVCGKHGKPAYLILLLDQSVHFNRKFYTEKDWKMLIEVMNEMQY